MYEHIVPAVCDWIFYGFWGIAETDNYACSADAGKPHNHLRHAIEHLLRVLNTAPEYLECRVQPSVGIFEFQVYGVAVYVVAGFVAAVFVVFCFWRSRIDGRVCFPVNNVCGCNGV